MSASAENGVAVIASEAKQPRGLWAEPSANAPGGYWFASPSARNDEANGITNRPGRVPVAIEWLAAAAVAALAILTLGQSYETVTLAITLATLPLVAWIVVQDLRSLTIPDGAVVALAALALATRVASHDPALLIGLDVLLTGGVLLAFREVYFRRRGFDGLGLGDVKLAAAGGLLVGAVAFAWALLAASLVAIAAVGIGHLRGRRAGGLATGKLAFGAVLAPAIYVAWLLQALPVLQGA